MLRRYVNRFQLFQLEPIIKSVKLYNYIIRQLVNINTRRKVRQYYSDVARDDGPFNKVSVFVKKK